MSGDVLGPPWETRRSWQAANFSVRFLLDRHPERMRPVFEIAGEIRLRMTALDAIYHNLCRQTCPLCPEPCCVTADVWFDLRDLLFLHAARLPLASGSPRKPGKTACWFLGTDGCMVPRHSRPWICTWYLCAVQKRRLQSRDPERLRRLRQLTQDIREYRKQLEECFIEIVCPGSPSLSYLKCKTPQRDLGAGHDQV